jgi:hypothetical protein
MRQLVIYASRLDEFARGLVVRQLRGLDQWSVIKLVLGLLAFARATRRLRQIRRTTGAPVAHCISPIEACLLLCRQPP